MLPLPLPRRVATRDSAVMSLQRPYFFHPQSRHPPQTCSSDRCSAPAFVSQLEFENRRRRYQEYKSWQRIRLTRYELHLWKPNTPSTQLSRGCSSDIHWFAFRKRSHRAVSNHVYYSPEWSHLRPEPKYNVKYWNDNSPTFAEQEIIAMTSVKIRNQYFFWGH